VPHAPAVQHLRVDDGGAGQRLDNFLLRVLKGVPKTHVYRVIRSGEVRVNMKRASADTRLVDGDDVRIPPVRVAHRPDVAAAASAPARDFDVLFEDEHLIAINKPAGVAVHGGSGVSYGVIEQLRRARPTAKFLELVHRLDKETSGVMLVAKKRSALTHLQDQFRDRETDKVYAALVFGHWQASKKVIDVPLLKTLNAAGERTVLAAPQHDDAKRAITLVKVVKHWAGKGQDLTLLDITIKTGRTHQIRVHLTHEGGPIVGDPKYGDFERNRALARGPLRFARMFLHAQRLTVTHPASGERLTVLAPLPAECERFLQQLGRA
jgi:23S rRNA pseudouridine955/2504/2580 synthase